MNLHVFNPEHDIALAAHLANFTAPHAGRQLRNDLGFLPALWAGEDDAVLVDNVAYAEKTFRRLAARLGKTPCRFVDRSQLAQLGIRHVEPWGWDRALCAQLKRYGVSTSVLPDEEQLERIRSLSHRRTSARLLPLLQRAGTVGEAFECDRLEQVAALMEDYGQVVVKAPWSSSGRGVRFDGNTAWIFHVLERQGSVMVEPYYNKVKDFGMEFSSTPEGIRYEGLSLFKTHNGAYTGNVLATERAKRQAMSRYVPLELLDAVCCDIVDRLDLKGYHGPFGIDMMVVAGGLLHPCVEINLRRTMGHVAIELGKLYNPTEDDDIRGVMRVMYNENNYKLKIQKQ